MFSLIKKIFGTAQSRKLKKFQKIVTSINALEIEYQKLTDEELVAKTTEFKKRYEKGESLNDLLPEAYAVVKNACRRLCGVEIHVSGYNQKWDMIPYDVQLLGAIAMHFGAIAEMQTGEGKTLTASLPLYLNALSGKPVHLTTVNDYLAKRDSEWIGPIFVKLGLSVAALTNDVPIHQRKEIYAHDIVYGTASEFGFDYLRDNSMASSLDEQVQRQPFYFAIVDEIDSILIDEARTPLIISGPSSESRQMYEELKLAVEQVVRMQRDLCNRLATEAKKTLSELGLFKESDDETPLPSLKKEDDEKKRSALKKLWLVNKGTPRNKILKRVKENPDLRVELERLETYYYSEQNKNEKFDALSELFIIVDERSNEYELTDKGISAWTKCQNLDVDKEDPFVMLDLGYEIDLIEKNSDLSEEAKVNKKIEIQNQDNSRKERAHNLQQLFRAHLLMEKDVDYIVQDNKIIIIDENTGRPQPGRRFSDGLHQAIEAKESVPIQGETQTYATITLQNYFRMYEKLAGMTGTAITEAQEFREIYHLEVLEIPTYCTCQRIDFNDEIYMTEREKYNALLKEIKSIHEQGRPLLIGTESVEISEKLSRILKQNQLPHVILNAKNHTKEAEIIAEAGRRSAITLATNMAGRGTDIKLKDNVKELGGLYVIATSRHHSRRIDRQLRGRSGRLGDPGSSKFFVSFEDSLMRLFASPRMSALLKKFRPPEGEAISAKILNRSIETAQKRVEQKNYLMRKHTLEYDDVMNRQRQEIYAFRNDLLGSPKPIEIARHVLVSITELLHEEFFRNHPFKPENLESYRLYLMSYFPVSIPSEMFQIEYLQIGDIEQNILKKVLEAFDQRVELQLERMGYASPDEKTLALEQLSFTIRHLMIERIDALWKEHLLAIDHLRSEVSLRAIGQKDPLIEFKQEAFHLFEHFSRLLKLEIAKDLFRFEMLPIQHRTFDEVLKGLHLSANRSLFSSTEDHQSSSSSEEIQEPPVQQPILNEKRTKRNEICPCGSGKKYKKCCGALAESKNP